MSQHARSPFSIIRSEIQNRIYRLIIKADDSLSAKKPITNESDSDDCLSVARSEISARSIMVRGARIDRRPTRTGGRGRPALRSRDADVRGEQPLPLL